MLRIRDPVPFLPLDSGYEMGKKSGSVPGSETGMKNLDHISESLETIFWVKILKFFVPDLGWKKFGYGINSPDPQHWFLSCKKCDT